MPKINKYSRKRNNKIRKKKKKKKKSQNQAKEKENWRRNKQIFWRRNNIKSNFWSWIGQKKSVLELIAGPIKKTLKRKKILLDFKIWKLKNILMSMKKIINLRTNFNNKICKNPFRTIYWAKLKISNILVRKKKINLTLSDHSQKWIPCNI